MCVAGALVVVLVMVGIADQLLHGGHMAISRFGLHFLTHTEWKPNFKVFGAGSLLYGTVVTSAMALLIAAPIAISIGLFLSLLAPRGLRSVVGPLVEMLAAVPSVILGFGASSCSARSSSATSRSCTAASGSSRSSARRRPAARACSRPA